MCLYDNEYYSAEMKSVTGIFIWGPQYKNHYSLVTGGEVQYLSIYGSQ